MEEFFIKVLSLGAILISVLIVSFVLSFVTKNTEFYSKFLKQNGLKIIFLFSLVATLGSLAMSMFFEMQPCDLCWYQRMFMYPVVFISGFALYKKDYKNGAIYSLMLAIVGALIAIYHYLLQISDTLSSSPLFCSPSARIDCSIPDFVEFGFVTTPYISLMAFVLIIIAAFYGSKNS